MHVFSHEKEGNSTICKNMAGIWEYCPKWNKSNIERQILNYSVIFVESV